MTYSDWYKKILDNILLDKLKLDGEIKSEEEEVIKRVMGCHEALKEKGGSCSDINVIPFRVYAKLGRDEVKPMNRGITMLNHSKVEPMEVLKDVLCQGSILDNIERTTSTFDGICHQKFRSAKTNVNIEESDSDDDEDYCIKRNSLGAPIYGPTSVKYLNCNDLMDCALALQEGCNRAAKTRYNTKLAHLLPKQIYSPCIVDWIMLNKMGYAKEIENMLEIKVYEAGIQEETFSYEAWIRAFDINEPIYIKLCHEIYSTYDFDEFARRLGLYHSDEVNEEGFDVYFQGGLRGDEIFNASDYWLSISSVEELHLSRSLASTIQSPILRVLQKMITYGMCQRTTGYDKVQKNELWLMSMFAEKHQNGYANVAWLMAKWLERKRVGIQKDSMICYGQLITKMRVDRLFEEGLIPEVPPGHREGAIKRMAYRQSYHWDMYHGVFEHMAGVYDVPLQGAYNLPLLITQSSSINPSMHREMMMRSVRVDTSFDLS
ncbi:hypothetical protein Tco_0719933 [Tanacetum coccineum]